MTQRYGLTSHESSVAEKLETHGWQLVRQGWPDWACVKVDAAGKITAVKFAEAKSGKQKLSHAQRLTFSVLAHIGFPVEVISDAEFYAAASGTEKETTKIIRNQKRRAPIPQGCAPVR